jgi:hypothetical protein
MRRPIEEIQRRMSQKLQMSDPLEHGHHPSIDVQSSNPACVLVARKKELGRQVELESVVSFELRIELTLKPIAHPESHDFILVLDGKKIATPLHQWKTNERLVPGQEDAARSGSIAIIE